MSVILKNIAFLGGQHLENFEEVVQKIAKCKIDNGYLAAAYILALPELAGKGAMGYISDDGFRWEEMLQRLDLSSGYRHMVLLAVNLFTGGLGDFNLGKANHCLDSDLFRVMVQAIILTRR